MNRQRNVTAPCPSCGADVSVEITTTGPVQYGTFKCDCGEEFEFENEFLGEATPAMNVTRSIESASNGQRNVFLVIEQPSYEITHIVGVFTTRELADAASDRLEHAWVQEFTLDEDRGGNDE